MLERDNVRLNRAVKEKEDTISRLHIEVQKNHELERDNIELSREAKKNHETISQLHKEVQQLQTEVQRLHPETRGSDESESGVFEKVINGTTYKQIRQGFNIGKYQSTTSSEIFKGGKWYKEWLVLSVLHISCFLKTLFN